MPTRPRFLALAAIATLAFATAFSHASPAGAAGGQTGGLKGTVVDAGSAAVSGAEITLAGPSGRYTAHTSDRGTFTLLGVLSDTYTLTIKQNGTVRVSQPGIGITGDQTLDLGKIALPAS